MRKMGNKGFSLVELIIVIAIIMIVAGIMIPQLVRYIEKSKVTADQETLEAVYKAVVYAMVDPEVQDDPASQTMINSLVAPRTLESLMVGGTNKFNQEILDTLGWADLNQTTYEEMMESAHASNCEIYLVYKGGVHNPIAMWITTTDNTGRRDTSQVPTTQSTIGHCINIQ